MTELQHYGVKGMRWGIRKRRPETDSERKYREYRSTVKNAKNAARSNISRAQNDMLKGAAKYDSIRKSEKQKRRDAKRDAASKLDPISYSQVVKKKAKAMAPLLAALAASSAMDSKVNRELSGKRLVR